MRKAPLLMKTRDYEQVCFLVGYWIRERKLRLELALTGSGYTRPRRRILAIAQFTAFVAFNDL